MSKHFNITCDECGVCPIVGVRYVAKHIYGYDICTSCLKEHDEADRNNFVGFPKRIAQSLATKVGPETDNSIRASTCRDAAEKIRRNEQTKVAILRLVWPDSSSDLQSALASNTHLQIIHIHMCGGFGDFEDSVIDIASGLMTNSSIKRVLWSFGKKERTERVALALRDMIAENSKMETCFLNRTCQSSICEDVDFKADAFAATVLEGLRKNKVIKSFRLGSFNVLSEKPKELLLDIVEENELIEKVYVEFERDDDHRLDLLLACRRAKWIERLSDCSSTQRSRVEVLEEALQFEKAEPVATAYHLLRSCPDLILDSVPAN